MSWFVLGEGCRVQSESVAGCGLDGCAGGVNHAAAFGDCALAPGNGALTDSDLCTVAVNCGNVAKQANIVQGHFGFHGSFRVCLAALGIGVQ